MRKFISNSIFISLKLQKKLSCEMQNFFTKSRRQKSFPATNFWRWNFEISFFESIYLQIAYWWENFSSAFPTTREFYFIFAHKRQLKPHERNFCFSLPTPHLGRIKFHNTISVWWCETSSHETEIKIMQPESFFCAQSNSHVWRVLCRSLRCIMWKNLIINYHS